MKIAFATRGSDLDAPLDDRLGKGCRFLVYDLESESFSMVDAPPNSGAIAPGAEARAACAMVRSGVHCLVAGHCDPSAHHKLCPFDIKLYNSDAPTVFAALEEYRAGRLAADVAVGWWG